VSISAVNEIVLLIREFVNRSQKEPLELFIYYMRDKNRKNRQVYKKARRVPFEAALRINALYPITALRYSWSEKVGVVGKKRTANKRHGAQGMFGKRHNRLARPSIQHCMSANACRTVRLEDLFLVRSRCAMSAILRGCRMENHEYSPFPILR
jgi:hypothetical protein